MAPNEEKQAQCQREFPTGFIIGAASASYQVEGAWNENGKSAYVKDSSEKLFLTSTYN